MDIIETPYDNKITVYNWQEGVNIILQALEKSTIYVKGTKERKKNYTDIIMAFDIETTKVLNINFDAKKQPNMYKYFNVTFCWQVSVNGVFIFGRSIDDFFHMLDKVSEVNKNSFIICYVHNLAYEYNNLADYFISRLKDPKEDIFFKSVSIPLFIRCGCFEFRCSKELTHKSLAKIGSDIGYNKLKDDFDYNIERYINTELTQLEMNYCYRDVMILHKFLTEEVKNYATKTGKCENPAILPLTSTGYVRADVQKNFSRTPKGHYILNHTALTEGVYDDIRNAFWGGFTHADYKKIGKECENVAHRDITSAYPSQFLKTFPYHLTLGTINNTELFLNNLQRENFAIIANITLTNLSIKPHMIPYLPVSKCEEKKIISDNGKVFGADRCTFWACDVDINLILSVYNYDTLTVNKWYYGIKQILPFNLVNTVLSYFEGKTEYKDIDELAFEYAFAKSLLNGIYGLSATACRHDDLIIDGLATVADGSTYKASNTIPFQWSIYITAYVRQLLYGFVMDLAKMDDAFIYSDTDSIFYQPSTSTENYFEEYNRKNRAYIEMYQKLYSNILPCTKKGEPQYLQAFEDEHDDIARFCTIGAKRYYVVHSDGLTELTFAGLSGTKLIKTSEGKKNGYNTERLINMYGSIHKAFLAIKATDDGRRGSVSLPYIEGIDKLSNYNTRYDYHGVICGVPVSRPCSYVLYGQSTVLSLNKALYDLITKEGLL